MRSSTKIWALLLLFASACSRPPALPALPKIDYSGFQPAVRQVVESAMQSAESEPNNAAAVAKLGMALHAHDRFSPAAICYQRAYLLEPSKFDYGYYLGSALIADGKYSEAVAPLRSAVQLSKTSVPAHLKLAEALLAAGQTGEAAAEYRNVLALEPNSPNAHYGLGRTQNGADAIASFRNALELHPRYGAAQFALAAAYRKSGEAAKAEAALAGYELNKSNAPLVEDPLMAAVYELNAGAVGLMRQAQILERQNRLPEALAVQEKALEQDPKLPQAWINLISLHGRLGHFDEAEAAFQKAIALAPGQADAYYNLGVLRMEQQRETDARKAFEKAVELDPRHANALHNLGSVMESRGQLEAAAKLFERSLTAMPEHRAARFQLGRIYANQRRYDDAIRQFEQLRQPVDEQTPSFLYALGATHARAGHRKEAVDTLQQALLAARRFGQQQVSASIERDLSSMGAR